MTALQSAAARLAVLQLRLQLQLAASHCLQREQRAEYPKPPALPPYSDQRSQVMRCHLCAEFAVVCLVAVVVVVAVAVALHSRLQLAAHLQGLQEPQVTQPPPPLQPCYRPAAAAGAQLLWLMCQSAN